MKEMRLITDEYIKYKKAFDEVIDSCFHSMNSESKRELNQRLNKIFGKGHAEYIKIIPEKYLTKEEEEDE